MFQRLSLAIVGLLLIPGGLSAQDPEILGRVFERPVTKAEFEARLSFLQKHLDARASADQLWRRLALLESAARQRMKISPAAQAREETGIIRQATIAARLRQRWPETPKDPAERELYEAEASRLQKELQLQDSDRKLYLETRGLSAESFGDFVEEQLILTALRQRAEEHWQLDERAYKKACERRGEAELELFSLDLDALPKIEAEAVPEGTLRAAFERDPLRYRRPREVAVEGLKRADDGDLRPFVEIRKALTAGAELQGFFAEPGVEGLRLERRRVDSSPENLWMGEAALRDFCLRAPVGELSPIIRDGGFQWLIRITEARPSGRSSFEEARAELEREWLAQARMGALLEQAHSWLRELRLSWRFVASPGRKDLGRHRLVVAAPRGSWPAPLASQAVEAGPGPALCVDMAQRRILLYRVLETRPPARSSISAEDLDKARERVLRRAAAEWQARVALEARRIEAAVVEYSASLLAPATSFVIRRMTVSEKDWSPMIESAFRAGESLEAIAARIGESDAPLRLELFEKRSPLAALAARCGEGEVAGPVRLGDRLHIVMTSRRERRGFGGEGQGGGWLAIYHISRRSPEDPAGIEKVFEDLGRVAAELRRAPPELRLGLFQRLARTRSEAPTAICGGLLGGIAEPKLEQRSLEDLLGLARAGERYALRSADQRLLVTILDERPLAEEQKDRIWMALDELADWSLPKD